MYYIEELINIREDSIIKLKFIEFITLLLDNNFKNNKYSYYLVNKILEFNSIKDLFI